MLRGFHVSPVRSVVPVRAQVGKSFATIAQVQVQDGKCGVVQSLVVVLCVQIGPQYRLSKPVNDVELTQEQPQSLSRVPIW